MDWGHAYQEGILDEMWQLDREIEAGLDRSIELPTGKVKRIHELTRKEKLSYCRREADKTVQRAINRWNEENR